MDESHLPSPAVIVGIDDSCDGVDAALWAVDEAVSRDIPLRLMYAVDPGQASGAGRGAAELDIAELAIRDLVTMVESTEKPVKVEVEPVHGDLADALLEASQSAAMICLAALEGPPAAPRLAGTTAAALVVSAECPVTVVRSSSAPGVPGWIVVALDDSTASDRVLERALDEARLRGAPLRVLTTWQLRFTDIHDAAGIAYRNRWARACLDRRLEPWRDLYPDVDMKAVAVHGAELNYVVKNLASIQLVIASGERADGFGDLLSPPRHAAIRDTDCSVMICQAQSAL